MKYFVNQKVFTFLTRKYNILEENGNYAYFVKSKLSIPYQLNFFSTDNQKVLTIKKRLFKFFPTFDIIRDGQIIFTMKAKFSFLRSKFKTMSSNPNFDDLQIEGNVLGFNFKILKNNTLLATVNKKVVSVGDKYSIDVTDQDNALVYLAIILILDTTVHSKNN